MFEPGKSIRLLWSLESNFFDPNFHEDETDMTDLFVWLEHQSRCHMPWSYQCSRNSCRHEAFFLNVLNLPEFDGKAMTAYEVSERMKEYIRRATPLFEPVDLEYNGQLCQTTFDILDRHRRLRRLTSRTAPPLLRGQKVEFKFANPLVQAEAETKTVSFTKVIAAPRGGHAVRSPPCASISSIGRAGRSAAPTTAPARRPNGSRGTKTKPMPSRRRPVLQQAAAAQAAALGHAGEQAGKAASAVKNVGDMAATSLEVREFRTRVSEAP